MAKQEKSPNFRAVVAWTQGGEPQVICESDLPEARAIAECQKALRDTLYSTGTVEYNWAGVQRRVAEGWADCALYCLGTHA